MTRTTLWVRTRSGRKPPVPCRRWARRPGWSCAPTRRCRLWPESRCGCAMPSGTRQMSTIQLDFNLPERFELEYTASDGSRQRPVMIHRALFGSIERFFGVLTEHYAGAFPVWLAPVQVVGIPVAAAFNDHLESVLTTLRANGVRVELDDSDDRMQKKIRNAQKQKIPFMLIAGGDDVDANAVSFRFRDGSQRNGVPVEDAIQEILRVIESRTNVDPTAPQPTVADDD